jgi:hypothetical protein
MKKRVPINRKDSVNILCKVTGIGKWVALLIDKGFVIASIVYVDPVKNQVEADIWNILAYRECQVIEHWDEQGKEGA